MPNNEERICIFKENFDTNITEIEGPKYMTLSEAVERMAKAMAANDVGGYIILAEAALDALLGGKNV